MPENSREERPQRPLIGAHLLIVKDDQVLLQKRASKKGLYGFYALIAGHVENGETPRQALVREALEETGIIVQEKDLVPIAVFHRPMANYKDTQEDIVEFIFKAAAFEGTPQNMEPDKCSELAFFSLDNLPEKITQTTHLALKHSNENILYHEITEN